MGKVLCIALALTSIYSLSLFAQEVTINKDGSVTLTLSPKEAELCKKGGGCVVMPVSDLEPLIRDAARFMCGKTI